MASWNKKDGFSIDGAVTAIKFRFDDGTLIRVSTENIPKKYMKNPDAPFDEIRSVLSGYLSKDNLIK